MVAGEVVETAKTVVIKSEWAEVDTDSGQVVRQIKEITPQLITAYTYSNGQLASKVSSKR